jgi:hypothetical protein
MGTLRLNYFRGRASIFWANLLLELSIFALLPVLLVGNRFDWYDTITSDVPRFCLATGTVAGLLLTVVVWCRWQYAKEVRMVLATSMIAHSLYLFFEFWRVSDASSPLFPYTRVVCR